MRSPMQIPIIVAKTVMIGVYGKPVAIDRCLNICPKMSTMNVSAIVNNIAFFSISSTLYESVNPSSDVVPEDKCLESNPFEKYDISTI